MKLIFGLHLDDQVAPQNKGAEGGVFICGPNSLLSIAETMLGLSGQPENIEYLRVEHFRQCLLNQLENHQDSSPLFYQKSFYADQFATAAAILNRRDELILSGWNFEITEDTPKRLKVIAELEEKHRNGNGSENPPLGYADRFVAILKELDKTELPFTEVWINEPIELLPPHFQHFFNKLKVAKSQPIIQQIHTPSDLTNTPNTDLQKFQSSLINPLKAKLAGDGSLIIFKAKRDSEAAAYIAKLLRLNNGFRPTCLIPEKNRVLDTALIKEGFPSLGILSASLARPALQILKLAPTFLWHPIDPFKILEFVTLALKPLPEKLAAAIADQVAQSPGIQGEGWYAMIGRYFSELEKLESPKVAAEHRKQYEFWFERQRYQIDKTAPKAAIIALFDHIREWAFKLFDENNGKNQSLLVLSEQAKRITELLQAVPEAELDFLSLERIVRTIYEPSPVTFVEKQVGHLSHIMQSAAFIGPVNEVLWWNFIQNEPTHFFPKWHAEERRFFEANKMQLDTPKQENSRLLWQQQQPVLCAKNRLILIIPEVAEGEPTLPHPLFGNLEASFENLDSIAIDSNEHTPEIMFDFNLPNWVELERRQLGKPVPFLNLGKLKNPYREQESLTSLESLFYYPYQWFFKHKIKLNKSAILSVVNDNTLMGNLAHRVFEKLMQEDLQQFESKVILDNWMEKESNKLFMKEGAVLLMYGREPERIAFVNKLKFSGWSLLSHIQQNGWKVAGTEVLVEGMFPFSFETGEKIPVKGIADLVLQRGNELAVIDLKWRGTNFRTNMLRNEEDLQLVFYSKLLSKDIRWAHTAYFILENGKMLARNNLAFKGITPIAPDKDSQEINENILQKMEKTWQWRMEQITNGEIEVRTRQTIQAIEMQYDEAGLGSSMLDFLEMKGEDAKWDNYRVLVNLIS